MLLYSVTVFIDEDIEDQWYEWMIRQHIPDVMKTGHFISAEMSRILEPETSRPAYRIEYRCANAAAYRAYAADHAPALQAEHSQRFAGRFEASRKLLALRESWDKTEAEGSQSL